MEWKGYESIGCYTYYVTLSYDFDLGFWWSKFKKLYHGNKWVDMGPKGCESIGCWTQVVTLNFDLTHDLDLGFLRSNFNSHILGMGRSIDLLWKRCELDTILDAQWACSWATVHGKCIGQIMGPWEIVTVLNLLAHEWAVQSLIWGVLLFTECLVPCLDASYGPRFKESLHLFMLCDIFPHNSFLGWKMFIDLLYLAYIFLQWWVFICFTGKGNRWLCPWKFY